MDLCIEKGNEFANSYDCTELAQGYKEMSRINLGLAEEAVASDNDALEICEQNIAECE